MSFSLAKFPDKFVPSARRTAIPANLPPFAAKGFATITRSSAKDQHRIPIPTKRNTVSAGGLINWRNTAISLIEANLAISYLAGGRGRPALPSELTRSGTQDSDRNSEW